VFVGRTRTESNRIPVVLEAAVRNRQASIGSTGVDFWCMPKRVVVAAPLLLDRGSSCRVFQRSACHVFQGFYNPPQSKLLLRKVLIRSAMIHALVSDGCLRVAGQRLIRYVLSWRQQCEIDRHRSAHPQNPFGRGRSVRDTMSHNEIASPSVSEAFWMTSPVKLLNPPLSISSTRYGVNAPLVAVLACSVKA
jgi:hypothetical protein